MAGQAERLQERATTAFRFFGQILMEEFPFALQRSKRFLQMFCNSQGGYSKSFQVEKSSPAVFVVLGFSY